MSAQIIIAEDEHPLRAILSGLLTDRGLTVLQAHDGVQALKLLDEMPGVSLLLSDVKMPNMNGYELVEAAVQRRPELKVLMMTAYATDHPPPAALKAREIRTLVKPFNMDRMCDLVCDMLARS
jgi:DNA-binding NtrC family response regulator